MANLSKIKREKMLDYLEKLKELNNDENIHTITEIENALNEKKYGLVWEEHSEKVDDMLEHNIPIFVEDEKRKITANGDEPYNFLLEGDNLHSLKLLEKTHKGKIDVIYIDPPYNTGNKDFIYDDSFVDKTDGYAHSKWLSFIERRLIIARELLSDAGVIFISIDDNEQAQLRLLCDEVFNERNILSTHHIQVRYDNKSLNEKNEWQPVMEYIYIYAKDKLKFKANQPYDEYNIDKFIYSIKELSNGEEIYLGGKRVEIFKKDEWVIEKSLEGKTNLLKETWASGSVLKGNTSGKFFDTYISNRKEIDGLCCLYKVEGIGEDGLGYRYFTGPQKANSIRGKFYSGVPLERLDELNKGISKKYKAITNNYDFSADFGNIRHEGGIGFNSGKKPIKLLKMLVNYHRSNSIIVLDFFAGSGTTGHAVMQLNKEDGGDRKYILCTNNENNICEQITYQRLKNIQEDLPHNLKYYKTKFVPKFSAEEDSISDKMMEHIKEFIELEHHIELDGKKYIILEDEARLAEVIERIENDGRLFVRSGIFLSRSNQRKLDEKQVNTIEIPEYYFRDELKEAGEL